jgi:hypothetical protein
MDEQLKEKTKVSEQLGDRALELLELPYVVFKYGDIDFFGKEDIDVMQEWYRNDLSNDEYFEDELGSEYVIIGVDSAGTGAKVDLFVIKTNEPNYPVYWLNNDGEDWKQPTLICNSLENFNTIIRMLKDYQNYLDVGTLTIDMRNDLVSRMANIMQTNSISNYWNNLLNACIENV